VATYIYDEIEVKLTGRTATKKRKRTRSDKPDLTLHEVQPLDDKIQWTRWVDLNDLFLVDTDV